MLRFNVIDIERPHVHKCCGYFALVSKKDCVIDYKWMILYFVCENNLSREGLKKYGNFYSFADPPLSMEYK